VGGNPQFYFKMMISLIYGLVFLILFYLGIVTLSCSDYPSRALSCVFGILFCLGFSFFLFTPLENICYKTELNSETSTQNETITQLTGEKTICQNMTIEPESLNLVYIPLWALFLFFFILTLFETYNLHKRELSD